MKGHGGAPSGSHAAWELQICWASALRDCFLPPRDFPIQPIQTIPGVQSHKFVSKTDLLALWQPKTPFVVFCHGSNTKKRPPVTLAWMDSKSGKPEGRGAAITRKWAVQLDPCTRIAPLQVSAMAHLLDRIPIYGLPSNSNRFHRVPF